MYSDVIDGDLLSLAYNRRVPSYVPEEEEEEKEEGCDESSVGRDRVPSDDETGEDTAAAEDDASQPDADMADLSSYLESVSACDVLQGTFCRLFSGARGLCRGSAQLLEGTSDGEGERVHDLLFFFN